MSKFLKNKIGFVLCVITITITSLMISGVATGFCYAAPTVVQIKLLDPQETYYASPFNLSVDNVVKNPLAPQDIASAFPDLRLGLGGVVRVWRAPTYQVSDGNKNIQIKSWGLSVKEVLNEQHVEVGEQDEVQPRLDSSVAGVKTINIIRVAQSEVKEYETIPYKTIDKDDPTLERGVVKVSQTGHDGRKEKTYMVTRKNGEEVSRALISSSIIDEKQDKIVLHGTKIVVLSSESGESSWTWRATASRTYSRGTLIRVTNLNNGQSVETRVGGYGPMSFTGRVLDLNIDSWNQIASGGAGSGTMQVKVEEIKE